MASPWTSRRTLLPGRSKTRFGLLTHLFLHARAQRQHGDTGGAKSKTVTISTERLKALIGNLRGTVDGLKWEPAGTEWADYADNTSYTDAATAAKARLVEAMLKDAGGDVVWDLGANNGRYSAIAAGLGRHVVSWDIDPAAVEQHHRALKQKGETRITPLLIDLADPSPAMGWALSERTSLVERSNADVLMGLALVHHLAIGRNVPLPMVASFFAELAPDLILEWVPRGDVMVEKLLSGRKDIFDGYHEEGFQAAFEGAGWETCAREPIEGSTRVLYRFRRRLTGCAGPPAHAAFRGLASAAAQVLAGDAPCGQRRAQALEIVHGQEQGRRPEDQDLRTRPEVDLHAAVRAATERQVAAADAAPDAERGDGAPRARDVPGADVRQRHPRMSDAEAGVERVGGERDHRLLARPAHRRCAAAWASGGGWGSADRRRAARARERRDGHGGGLLSCACGAGRRTAAARHDAPDPAADALHGPLHLRRACRPARRPPRRTPGR